MNPMNDRSTPRRWNFFKTKKMLRSRKKIAPAVGVVYKGGAKVLMPVLLARRKKRTRHTVSFASRGPRTRVWSRCSRKQQGV